MPAKPRKKAARRKPTLAELYAATSERRARRAVCRRCGAEVLQGLDEKVCALTAVVDPVPVTAAQELLALARGLWSYRVLWLDGRRELWRRDCWSIAGTPPQPPDDGDDRDPFAVIVVLDHQCPHRPDSGPMTGHRRAHAALAAYAPAFPLEHHPRSPA